MIAVQEATVYAASGPLGAELAAWAAESLGAAGWRAEGLYVATATAGHAESVQFWRAALDTGLAFANPRLFPWALANSPTGAIARALDVRGPTYTLVGGAEAVAGALEHALDDLDDGVVASAAVVAVDVVEVRPRLVALRLDTADAARQLIDALALARETGRRRCPAEILGEWTSSALTRPEPLSG